MVENKFKTIYYANYNIKSVQKINHTLWLNSLLLLVNKILIPPTHLLRMNFEDLINLKTYSSYISRGNIYTNLYDGFNNVTQYLEYKIGEISESKQKYNTRLSIISDLFSSSKSYKITTAYQQSNIFTEIVNDNLKSFYNGRNHNINDDELKIIENAQNILFEKNSRGFIYRFEFEEVVNNLFKDNKIKKNSLKKIFKIIDNSYYVAGALHNKAIISYSERNNKLMIPSIYGEKPVSFYYYNPNFFLTFLKTLGIITSFDEFNKINRSELTDLRNTKIFNDFIREYESLFKTINNINLDNLENLLIICKLKKEINFYKKISEFIHFIMVTLPIDLYLGSLPVPLSISIIIIKFILLKILEDSKIGKCYKKNISDKLCSRVIEIFNPFSAFCYKLKKIIDYKE